MTIASIRRGLIAAREQARIARGGVIDTLHTLRWSSRMDGAFHPRDLWSLECQMTKDYHRVEKGLALATPKRPFGAEVGARLRAGRPHLDGNEPLRDHVASAIDALERWNSEGRIDDVVAPIRRDQSSSPSRDWFSARHSIRDFSTSQVPRREEIDDAVALASSTTPSVCNRQAWKAYVCTDPQTVRDVLTYQNGNAGFRETVPAIIVVSVSRRLFAGAGERNQMFVDGGLFAMTIAWVLHSRDIDSCMLNWSMSNRDSRRLRRRIGASDDEEIITLMALGYARDGARVARSPRRPADELIHTIAP
jgi:nitroreductase